MVGIEEWDWDYGRKKYITNKAQTRLLNSLFSPLFFLPQYFIDSVFVRVLQRNRTNRICI